MDEQLKYIMFEVFDKLKRNTIQLSYNQVDKPIGIGQSKIGGKPDVPRDFVWPYYEGESYGNITANRPLAFLAQINLAEASFFDKDGLLPKTGVLSFFYELETEMWGFDPKDEGCARVFYFENETRLTQTDFPEDLHQDYHFPEFSVSFEAKVDLPSYMDFCETPEELALSEKLSAGAKDCDYDDFDELYDEMRQEYGCSVESNWSEHTKLLGYPDVIQESMEQECEEVTRGIYNGQKHELPDNLADEIEKESKNWILLFQMGTVGNANFELIFGDLGHIYFWIKKQDLAMGNFEHVWMILQCS